MRLGSILTGTSAPRRLADLLGQGAPYLSHEPLERASLWPHTSPHTKRKPRAIRLALVTGGPDSFISSVEGGAERRCHECI